MHLYKKVLGAGLASAIILGGAGVTAAPAAAQSYSYYGGAANVSVANGNVVIVRADSGNQVAATINAPVVPGDVVSTGGGSSAEVQFDGASMLRLASNTQVRFSNLNPGSRDMQLAVGTVDLAQLQGANGGAQVDTPSLSLRPSQNGDYRVSVLPNGETLVTVRSGAATISSANGSRTLTPGSTLVAYGSQISFENPVPFDGFDQFNQSRDKAVASAFNSNPYLSPLLAGYTNLSNYGQWQNVPGYGYAWAPFNQSAGNFAPYQNGQWVWEPGYGYTWVDNAPYGYVTSHYGSWFNNSQYGGWLWQPPAYQYQTSPTNLSSIWLPAAVAFFLTGNNGNPLSFLSDLLGGGAFPGYYGGANPMTIGWIPLAPGEPYQPWYGPNYTFPQTGMTSVTNVTNVYNVYRNAQYVGGISAIPVNAWRSGNFRQIVVLRPEQIHRIVLVHGAVPIVPTSVNLRYAAAKTVAQPIAVSHEFVRGRLASKAPSLTHVAFETQAAKIRAITSVRPKAVAYSAHPATRPHPVYHPQPHPAVHVASFHPVPAHRPASAPAPRAAAHHESAPKPEAHRVVPAPKPHVAPAPKPEMHRVAPAPKPEMHRVGPAPKPVTHVVPAPKPEVRHVAPAPVQPHPEAKPEAKPETKPAPKAESKPHPKSTPRA